MLDNSVAFWMNELSDGNAHNMNNTPLIQAGSAGGYFKQGKIVNLDTTSGGTATNFLGRSLSQCVDGAPQMADGVNQGTGTEAKYGNMPINKYFCNVMTALGMKADAKGFPAKDGPASPRSPASATPTRPRTSAAASMPSRITRSTTRVVTRRSRPEGSSESSASKAPPRRGLCAFVR